MDTQRSVGLPWLVLLLLGLERDRWSWGLWIRPGNDSEGRGGSCACGGSTATQRHDRQALQGRPVCGGCPTRAADVSHPRTGPRPFPSERCPQSPHLRSTLPRSRAVHRGEALWHRALAIQEQALGSTHPDVATSLHYLAVLSYGQDQHTEAEPLAPSSCDPRTSPGLHHPDVARSLYNLAHIYYTQGRYAEAEPLWHRALAIWEQALGPPIQKSPAVSTTWPYSTSSRVGTPRRSPSLAGPSPSKNRLWAPPIPTSQLAFIHWPCSTPSRAGTPRGAPLSPGPCHPRTDPGPLPSRRRN